MFVRVLSLLPLLGLLVCCAPSARAQEGKVASAIVDPEQDPRLAVRVRLRSEGIPLRRVLRALSEATGVRLDASGPAGDERLVAFVPDAPLAEVMLAIADLYRLAWLRGGSAERRSYQLLKQPAVAREEQELRERAFRQLLARLEETLRTPQAPPPGQRAAWATVYPLVLPVITANSADLLRDGSLYLPISAFPLEQRQRLTAALQPILNAQHEALLAFLRASRERRRAEGKPEFQGRVAGEDGPPASAQTCTVTVELRVGQDVSAGVGLKTGTGTWYSWLYTSGDGLQEAGLKLYQDRHPRLPATPEEEPEGKAGADPLARVVEVAPEKEPRPGDWIGALGRLSDTAQTAIYTDCYPNYLEGITGHPRSDLTVSGKISMARALNSLCYPLGNRGTQKLDASSFWWRRGAAALVRSRRWLWESPAVLPTDLLDRLIASLRATRQIDPVDLPAIASLTPFQIESIGFLDGHNDTWRLAVQLPAQLSLGARRLLLTEGLTWEKLPPGDRADLAGLLFRLPGGDPSHYSARLTTRVESFPAQGGTVAGLRFQAAGAAQTEESVVYFPLPGVGAVRGLPPQGLLVERK